MTTAQVETIPEELRIQRAAWDRRPLLRAIYVEWFGRIVNQLSPVDGPTVELGCGIGAFKGYRSQTVATDVMLTPWTEAVVDAQRLPYADSSVANLVLIDVLHHLPQPRLFLAEAERVLRPGGRVVMVEPYCSPISTALYKLFHFERTDLHADAFGGEAQSESDPFDSNQALPTLMFWRQPERLRARHPGLQLARRDRFSLLAWPLSGGFTGRQLVPHRLLGLLQVAERLLRPLASLGAFRCLVVLEKRPAQVGQVVTHTSALASWISRRIAGTS
jgi:SAM-dependent methyltransferase